MRRLGILALVLRAVFATGSPMVLGLALMGGAALAQEREGGEKKSAGAKEESFAEKYELELKWANFLVLAGALGYLIGKNAGPFFAARSAGIRKDMDESLRQRQEAEARAADVDRRLASLETEIAALRGAGVAEAQAESQRVTRQTAAELVKIQAHAEQEIASAGKAARMSLKRYSGELAIGLAETKVRARMTPSTEDELVQGFVRNLTT